ncbi:MAG TPA: DNA replication and repair protein RecF [Acidimicrobiales bacterium]
MEITDFRSFHRTKFEPAGSGLTVISGHNGAGKTSLLEAIGYLSVQESFRGSPREALVRVGASSAVIRGEFEEQSRPTLVEVKIAPPRRDVVQRNRQRVSRVRELLETSRVTVFSPDDLSLVKGGPAERRRYLDDVLVSAFPRHATLRQSLDRILRQRGVLLRQAGGRLSPEIEATLDVWDEQLVDVADELTAARQQLVAELNPWVRDAFSRLTKLPESLELTYELSYAGDFRTALGLARASDLKRQSTGIGPHRDEVMIDLGDLDARSRLSQGRQRAVTLALRLASHEVVTHHVGSRPLLLLDDAFSELDEATANALVRELPEGQAVLTTAGPLPLGLEAAVTRFLEQGTLS